MQHVVTEQALLELVRRYRAGAPPIAFNIAALWLTTSETCTATVSTLRGSPGNEAPDTQDSGVAIVASCMAALRFFPVEMQTRLIRQWATLMVRDDLGPTWAAAKRLLGAQTASVRAAAGQRAHTAGATAFGLIGQDVPHDPAPPLGAPTPAAAAAALDDESDEAAARRNARARRPKRPLSPSQGDEHPAPGEEPPPGITDSPPLRRRRSKLAKASPPLQLAPPEPAERTLGAASPTPVPAGLPPLRHQRVSETSSAMAAPTWVSFRGAGPRLSWHGPDSARSHSGVGVSTLPPLPPPHVNPGAPPTDTAGGTAGRRTSETSGSGLPPWRRSSGGAASSQFYAGSYHPSPDSHHAAAHGLTDARLSSATSAPGTVAERAPHTLTAMSLSWTSPVSASVALQPGSQAHELLHASSVAQVGVKAEADTMVASTMLKNILPGSQQHVEPAQGPTGGLCRSVPVTRMPPLLPLSAPCNPGLDAAASQPEDAQPAAPLFDRRSSLGGDDVQSAEGGALRARRLAHPGHAIDRRAADSQIPRFTGSDIRQLAWRGVAMRRGQGHAPDMPCGVTVGADATKRHSNDENVALVIAQQVDAVRSATLAQRGSANGPKPRQPPPMWRRVVSSTSLPPLTTDVIDPKCFGRTKAPQGTLAGGAVTQAEAAGEHATTQPSLEDVYGDVGDYERLSARFGLEGLEVSVSRSGSVDVCSALSGRGGAAVGDGVSGSAEVAESLAGACARDETSVQVPEVSARPFAQSGFERKASSRGHGAERGGLPNLLRPAACRAAVPAA